MYSGLCCEFDEGSVDSFPQASSRNKRNENLLLIQKLLDLSKGRCSDASEPGLFRFIISERGTALDSLNSVKAIGLMKGLLSINSLRMINSV